MFSETQVKRIRLAAYDQGSIDALESLKEAIFDWPELLKVALTTALEGSIESIKAGRHVKD